MLHDKKNNDKKYTSFWLLFLMAIAIHQCDSECIQWYCRSRNTVTVHATGFCHPWIIYPLLPQWMTWSSISKGTKWNLYSAHRSIKLHGVVKCEDWSQRAHQIFLLGAALKNFPLKQKTRFWSTWQKNRDIFNPPPSLILSISPSS
jgi:hypothetical protein